MERDGGRSEDSRNAGPFSAWNDDVVEQEAPSMRYVTTQSLFSSEGHCRQRKVKKKEVRSKTAMVKGRSLREGS